MANILLIEDDDALRKMLRLTLTHMGHSVVEARDGREGMALHDAQPVDVVLTDLIMPDKEGLETIMELRRKKSPARIVAMSGGGRGSAQDYLGIARQLGAASVLKKPFSDDELAAAIRC